MRPLLIDMREHGTLTSSLASAIGAQVGSIELRRFPDEETYLRYESSPKNRDVVLLCSMDRPDARFLPLLFAADTAKELGATSVGLVSPYLPYMRQDRRFHPGEAVTSACFARAIGRNVDWLVTVDPHLHRRKDLSEIFEIPACAVHIGPAIAAWLRESVSRPVLIGPDAESEQWVSAVAREASAPYLIMEKRRYGDRDVEVTGPDFKKWKDHTPVLLDDIVSTGQTMVETIGQLARSGMREPVCIAIHGVFAADAYRRLLEAGASRIVTSNTIPQESNAIDVTDFLASAIEAFT
ncbi:ribose-phosphate diphosphokinase [Stappia sp. GBMRC 2046]|uniref:ribose-phosphate diphosphokinase n=1 Tax=Stappia sediminis TaxID=2692190 RepID=A0A7X3LY74_9HYPH|nr:ribose-phosphate pyrophosphokinase [Stappia sediminis]MXN67280.1 ribose-phosphate diphosphokinase [Stappia sediminis]